MGEIRVIKHKRAWHVVRGFFRRWVVAMQSDYPGGEYATGRTPSEAVQQAYNCGSPESFKTMPDAWSAAINEEIKRLRIGAGDVPDGFAVALDLQGTNARFYEIDGPQEVVVQRADLGQLFTPLKDGDGLKEFWARAREVSGCRYGLVVRLNLMGGVVSARAVPGGVRVEIFDYDVISEVKGGENERM